MWVRIARPEPSLPETSKLKRVAAAEVPSGAPRGCRVSGTPTQNASRSALAAAGGDRRLKDRNRIGRRKRLLQAAFERPLTPAPLRVLDRCVAGSTRGGSLGLPDRIHPWFPPVSRSLLSRGPQPDRDQCNPSMLSTERISAGRFNAECATTTECSAPSSDFRQNTRKSRRIGKSGQVSYSCHT